MSDRFDRGVRQLEAVDRGQVRRIVAGLRDIAPDFARYLVEFPFGDIYARPGLDLRAREIAALAALTVLGTAPDQLKAHVQAARNVGVSREEIVEVIMQMVIYAGFPASLNALAVAREAFAAQCPPPA